MPPNNSCSNACEKDAILKEMKEEHKELEGRVNSHLETVDKRLNDGSLLFLRIEQKVDRLIASDERVTKRLFIDNGTKSHQSIIGENSRDISEIKSALKGQRTMAFSLLAGIIMLIVTTVIDHVFSKNTVEREGVHVHETTGDDS